MVNAVNPFVQAEQYYRQLQAQLQAGQITQQAFEQAQAACIVQDANGGRWFPAPEQGHWLQWNGAQWVPFIQPPTPPPSWQAPPPANQGYYNTPPPANQAGWNAPPAPGRNTWSAPVNRPPLLRVAPQVRFFGQPVRQPTFQGAFAKTGSGCGCLVPGLFILGILLIGGLVGLYLSPIGAKLNLRKTSAETYFGQVNRATAQDLSWELSQEQANPGELFYVLPITGTNQSVLYIVADASLGFNGIAAQGSSDNPVLAYLAAIAQSETVRDANIVRVGLDYRDESGKQIGVISVAVADLLAFGQGELSAQDMLARLDGRMNLVQLVKGMVPK